MSYFNDSNLGFPTEVFTSYTPDNSQTYYLPSTIQENESNYQFPNSFGYFDQDYVPENSYQYFGNGHQLSEEGNQVISDPILSQVYVPESQIYKVVHAVEYHGTTYFYESLVDFTVYRFCPTTTYTPPHVVDENTLDVYWPGENTPTEYEEQYIENTSEYDYQPSFVENLITENDVILSPLMNMSSFYSPELDLDTSTFNNYSNACYFQSQCDLIENYHTITNSAVIEENVMYGNESTLYYGQVNDGWSHLRNDLSLGRDSGQDPMQAPVLSLEALDKNAIQAQVKYRKDSMYLTAISGKLYQKQSIPVVEKMPAITEVEDEYRMIDCSNKAIENKKSVVQVNTCIKYSKKFCRSKSIRVSQSLTEIENSNHEDYAADESIGTFSNTLRRIDSTVRENIFSNRCEKMYKKESFLIVENMNLMKEVSNKVAECSRNIPKAKQTFANVVEEKILVKRTERLVRKIILQNFGKMPSVQETDKHLQIDETNEIGNKGQLKSFQTEEVNADIDKDSEGFLDKNENIEKNLFAQENGFLSKTIEIPQAEDTNTENLLYSMDVGKSSMINDERSSLNRCEGTTDLIDIAGNNIAEDTLLSPIWEEVDLKETLETATAHESENEPTKVHSQKPKKKRFENFRKFLERLLCCCTKGPT